MKTKSTFILLLIPSLLLAMEITKESARNVADLVILGRVESIRRFQRHYSEGTDLLQAKLAVLNQRKGPPITGNTIKVLYEAPIPGESISRCPPFVELTVGQTALFAICTTTNYRPPSVTYFLSSSCFVDTEHEKITNANIEVHGSLDPRRVSAP